MRTPPPHPRPQGAGEIREAEFEFEIQRVLQARTPQGGAPALPGGDPGPRPGPEGT